MFFNKTISILFLSGFLGSLSPEVLTPKAFPEAMGDSSATTEMVAGVPLTSQDQGEPESTMSGTTRSGFASYGKFMS